MLPDCPETSVAKFVADVSFATVCSYSQRLILAYEVHVLYSAKVKFSLFALMKPLLALFHFAITSLRYNKSSEM